MLSTGVENVRKPGSKRPHRPAFLLKMGKVVSRVAEGGGIGSWIGALNGPKTGEEGVDAREGTRIGRDW